ncbi:MAG: pyruvate kinase [Rhabdochlamydiaceae bacterium]
MSNRTKIVCTMGPSVSSLEQIFHLIEAGMNVARLNFGHGTHDEHQKVVNLLKEARAIKQVPLAIMIDIKGPDIRVGSIKGGELFLKPKQLITISKEWKEGCEHGISLRPAVVIDNLEVGQTILFDDGSIMAKVVEKGEDSALIEIQNEGFLKSSKSINIPGAVLSLPIITDKDVEDIQFAVRNQLELMACSFVCHKEHMLAVRKLVTDLGHPGIRLIAKIESSLGVQHIDDIIEFSDGIMVARGDLGVELPLKKVPILQKMIIAKCQNIGKPVIVATQMLESMIKSPRPTRAEVSDVANAIYDSAACVMLSGETAVGKYPIETVDMMKSVIEETEKHFDYKRFLADVQKDSDNISSSVAIASVETANHIKAKAIFVVTQSGLTAQLISRLRPNLPIFALTFDAQTYHQMSYLWGVFSLPPQGLSDLKEAFNFMSKFCLDNGFLKSGDAVVITSGTPFGLSGATNMMLIDHIR